MWLWSGTDRVQIQNTATVTEVSAYSLFLPGKWSFYVSRLVGDRFSKCLINSKSAHKVGHFGINLQGCKNLQEEYAIGGFLKVRTKCCWSYLIEYNRNCLGSSRWVSQWFLWWEPDIWTWGEDMSISCSWFALRSWWGNKCFPKDSSFVALCVCVYVLGLQW